MGTTAGCSGLSFTVTVSSLLSASEKQATNKYPTILFTTMSWILCCISLHTIQPNCTNENIFVQPIMTAHVKEVQGTASETGIFLLVVFYVAGIIRHASAQN